MPVQQLLLLGLGLLPLSLAERPIGSYDRPDIDLQGKHWLIRAKVLSLRVLGVRRGQRCVRLGGAAPLAPPLPLLPPLAARSCPELLALTRA